MHIQQTEGRSAIQGLCRRIPDRSLGIEAVRQVDASSYPENMTAAVSGPELAEEKKFTGSSPLTSSRFLEVRRLAATLANPNSLVQTYL